MILEQRENRKDIKEIATWFQVDEKKIMRETIKEIATWNSREWWEKQPGRMYATMLSPLSSTHKKPLILHLGESTQNIKSKFHSVRQICI